MYPTTRTKPQTKEKDMHIRITCTPSGIGPEDVRQGWVGIVLKYKKKITARPLTDRDMLNRDNQKNLDGYMVNGIEALNALQRHNPKAHEWWMNNYPNADFGNLVFTVNECEEVSP